MRSGRYGMKALKGSFERQQKGFEAGLNLLVYVILVLAVLALLLYFYYNSYYEKGMKPFMDRLFKGFGAL